MDTQSMYTFFSVSTGGYITKMNTVHNSQVEHDTIVEGNDTSWQSYRQIVAGQSGIVPQFSDIKDGKLDSRDIIDAALGITLEATNTVKFKAASDKMTTDLFTKLAKINGITYDSNANVLKYDDLLIKVSVVDSQFEAKICMPGGNLSELKSKIQKFYDAAGIKRNDQSGRYVQDGIYFPAIDVADKDLRHYYNTQNDSVIIDMYAYRTIEIALQQVKYTIIPLFFSDKSEKYNAIGSMSLDIASKTLAFTYEQMREINGLLLKFKNNREQSVAQLNQQHNLEVQRLQQVNAQKDKEIEDLTKEVEFLSSVIQRK